MAEISPDGESASVAVLSADVNDERDDSDSASESIERNVDNRLMSALVEEMAEMELIWIDFGVAGLAAAESAGVKKLISIPDTET